MGIYRHDEHWRTKLFINSDLPKLRVEDVDWAGASHPTPDLSCNCMGFALGLDEWWEPGIFKRGKKLNPYATWPANCLEDESIAAFASAAESQGFSYCYNAEWENGFQKIVLYYKDGLFTHAARITAAGRMKSKLGEYSDIEHDADALDCELYGDGRVYMKRSVASAAD